MDQDIEKIKKEQPPGIPAALMRTCNECGLEKGVSQFQGGNQTCRKCLINKTRARMKEANKPADKFQDPSNPEIGQIVKRARQVVQRVENNDREEPQGPAHYIEAGGLRIHVCQSCLRRFLGI